MKEEIFIDQFSELIKMGIFENSNFLFLQLDDLYSGQQIQVRLDKEQIEKMIDILEKYLKDVNNDY